MARITRLVENKVALVTGAGSGIGRASALAFSREGAKVVVADVSVEGGEETVRLIKAADGKAIFVKTDVTKATEVEALIQKIADTYGRLDCAHNNAGIEGIVAMTADYPEEMWDRVLKINLKGAFLSMKYEIPQMLKQGVTHAVVNRYPPDQGGTVGSSLHREYLGELSNGPRGWNPQKEGAAFRDGLWVETLVPGGAGGHRCCAD